MSVSVEELPSLVTEGALFMDAIDPEWFWIVDPETLDMGSAYRCVLGQHSPLETFHRFDVYYLSWTEVYELGFVAFKTPLYELTRLWRDEINDRRAEWFAKHDKAAA